MHKGSGASIFLSKKWVDKAINISKISDRMIAIKTLAQGIIISVISVYAPQGGLHDRQKDNFCDTLDNDVGTLGEKDTAVIAGTSMVML